MGRRGEPSRWEERDEEAAVTVADDDDDDNCAGVVLDVLRDSGREVAEGVDDGRD